VEAGFSGDVSLGLKIYNLGGGASEWVRDDTAPLNSICWMQNGLDLPKCVDPMAADKEFRGGSWFSPPSGVPSGQRNGGVATEARLDVGFRCVREAP
jgi:formylglycine-generating enzyme required for sulfatase activity